jgi:hypothetical protein
MRKFVFFAVILAAVVGAGIAYSAASPGEKLAKQDRVWGGGYVAASDGAPACSVNEPTICILNPRNFAVDAHAEGDGSQAVGNSAYSFDTSRTVTCESVDGSRAAIGGVVSASALDHVGWVYVQYFIDRGTTDPQSPQHDYMSLVYTGRLDSSWPAGFPYLCPPAGGTPSVEAVYFEMTGGDVTVQDAPNT